MKLISFAATALISIFTPMCAFAQSEITEPTEVGTTTLPPGEYSVVSRSTARAYTLTVTGKGTMIMSPALIPPITGATPELPETPLGLPSQPNRLRNPVERGMLPNSGMPDKPE